MQDDIYLLLVDDNAQITELMLLALAEQHPQLRVTTLTDGAEVLDFLHARGDYARPSPTFPAAILLDIKMRCVDGLEVLRQVKLDQNLKTIPVVMLTSSSEPADLWKSYQLGANAYVVKPAEFQRLNRVMNQLAEFWTCINVPPPSLAPEPSLNASARLE